MFGGEYTLMLSVLGSRAPSLPVCCGGVTGSSRAAGMAGTGGGDALFHWGLAAVELLWLLFAPIKMLFTRVPVLRILDFGRETLPGPGYRPLNFRRSRKSVRKEPLSSSGMGSDIPIMAPPEDRWVF
jgi:hypothetical protein